MIFDPRPCELGEGPLWHPERGQLFWFDILNRKLLSRDASGPLEWTFTEIVSAAGWISRDELLIASESGLSTFHLTTGARETVVTAGSPATRSNDGRADRQGGFWFGTMGKRAEKGAGAIWRWYRGELRKLFPDLTIPNAICFTPDGTAAHFTDTVTGKVMKVALDAAGWPKAAPEIWLDLSGEDLNPDGAVTSADGTFWNAQWGAGRIAAYAPDGRFLRAIAVPGAPQTSCPAFGGAEMTTLHVTTALEHMDAASRVAHPASGRVFAFADVAKGITEPQVQI
ncbi:MAG: gluconolactonase [Rhodobacter sp.]|nr:gluconolactonase [Rhodobacter sp.]